MCVYIYIYIYIYAYIHTYIVYKYIHICVLCAYIYIYIQRERESERRALECYTDHCSKMIVANCRRPISLYTKIIPTKVRRLRISGEFPVDMRIPPLEIRIPLESNPLKSRIFYRNPKSCSHPRLQDFPR